MSDTFKRIHVNVNVIRHNKKYNNTLPACRTEDVDAGTTTYSKEVWIWGPSKMVYSPDKPLPCGAKLWIETWAEVEYVNPVAYSEIKQQMEEITSENRK